MKQMCQDRYARETGAAHLSANPPAAHRLRSNPLFQRWQQAKLDIARRHADLAPSGPQRGARAAGRAQDRAPCPSPADMMSRQEDRLKQRLADIEAERPALEAFYNALSPRRRCRWRARLRDGMGRPHGRRCRDGMVRVPYVRRCGGRAMGGPMGRAPDGPAAAGRPAAGTLNVMEL